MKGKITKEYLLYGCLPTFVKSDICSYVECDEDCTNCVFGVEYMRPNRDYKLTITVEEVDEY